MRVYNFSAGPSMLPEEVLLTAQAEMLDCRGSGMSVCEMSHRSKTYDEIHHETLSLFKELLGVPDNYTVLLVQGGASQQFDAIPLNLLQKGKADYVVTGNFAKLAYKSALKYGDIACVASSEDKNFTYIPDMNDPSIFRKDTDYVYITANNTIFGTRYVEFPKTEAPLVADFSSSILSEEIDISKFGIVYAGAQKNIAPAGLTVVIVRNDLIGNALPICPTMLNYKTQADKESLYNTPPCFAIYMAGLTLKWLKSLGGVKEINKINVQKANKLYDFIDNSSFYKNPVEKKYRSLMNVTFTSPNPDLDAAFAKEAANNGLVSIKGHRLVGGMRASIYNAMPMAGIDKLIDFMKKFELANK